MIEKLQGTRSAPGMPLSSIAAWADDIVQLHQKRMASVDILISSCFPFSTIPNRCFKAVREKNSSEINSSLTALPLHRVHSSSKHMKRNVPTTVSPTEERMYIKSQLFLDRQRLWRLKEQQDQIEAATDYHGSRKVSRSRSTQQCSTSHQTASQSKSTGYLLSSRCSPSPGHSPCLSRQHKGYSDIYDSQKSFSPFRFASSCHASPSTISTTSPSSNKLVVSSTARHTQPTPIRSLRKPVMPPSADPE